MNKLERKAIIGHKIRRFRQNKNLSQTDMAAAIGISPSYLNLIEHNQRPVTVSLLFRLGQAFEVDLKEFAEDDEARFAVELNEIFADPLFEGAGIGNAEIQELSACAPHAAQAIIKLYQVYRQMWENAQHRADESGDRETTSAAGRHISPVDEVRDFLQQRANHFADLETVAEDLWDAGELEKGEVCRGLAAQLKNHHGLETKVMPVSFMGDVMRQYDHHRRRILLSEANLPEGRTFQLAVQYALLVHGGLLDHIVGEAELSSNEARGLLRYVLANYLAGALMMPYGPFLESAQETRYDIELLRRRFGASFEQVCHRLTTLQRSGARGVSFFFLRVDNAGNISKRLSGGGFQFARFGGTCPRWVVHDAFSTPGQVLSQIIRMPDDTTFFTIACTVNPGGSTTDNPSPWHAVAVGCDIRDAKHLVYSDKLDATNPANQTPTGISCQLCTRFDCVRRAYPPLNRPVLIEENVRRAAPFRFEN
ncbi:MAG: short-chain fatty acyl-CoA regulator family protein [Rhodospirillales bacterium]|nr:short-chain fatty acyl-CoA regulator family protein [Rhodospirillales bacterium]